MDSTFIKKLNNLKSMVEHNFGLSTILDSLKSLLAKKDIDGTQFFINAYRTQFDITKKTISNEKKVVLDLINNNFDKIITTNYDNIFTRNELESPKEYIKNWTNNIDEISGKVYPIHGTIVNLDGTEVNEDSFARNDKKLKIIDSYESFIQNWIINDFMKCFKELLKMAVAQDYTIIFLGYSFEDQFVANSLATFILESSKKNLGKRVTFIYYLMIIVKEFQY